MKVWDCLANGLAYQTEYKFPTSFEEVEETYEFWGGALLACAQHFPPIHAHVLGSCQCVRLYLRCSRLDDIRQPHQPRGPEGLRVCKRT